jgi:hypothetical protein
MKNCKSWFEFDQEKKKKAKKTKKTPNLEPPAAALKGLAHRAAATALAIGLLLGAADLLLEFRNALVQRRDFGEMRAIELLPQLRHAGIDRGVERLLGLSNKNQNHIKNHIQ